MMAKKTITLSPGESKVVPFEAIPTEARVYSVNVDGLTGSFETVSPEEPPPEEWPRHRLYVLVLSEYKPYLDDYENTASVTFRGVGPDGSYEKTVSGYAAKRGVSLYEGLVHVSAVSSRGQTGSVDVDLLSDKRIELWVTW